MYLPARRPTTGRDRLVAKREMEYHLGMGGAGTVWLPRSGTGGSTS
jgi:hypothetical protein